MFIHCCSILENAETTQTTTTTSSIETETSSFTEQISTSSDSTPNPNGWGTWEEWEKCDVKLKGGTRRRKRQCQKQSGRCEDTSIQYQSCFVL